jgi:hypothetical protein
MGTPRLRSPIAVALFTASALVVSLGAGCGGTSDPPARPLGRHFDDSFLHELSVDQRKAEIEAKQLYEVAVIENQKATADLRKARTDVEVAKNERASARNDEKSAELRHKDAQASADMNRMKTADTELRGVRAAREAADNRYSYLEAYEKWLKRIVRYTEHNMYWQEAKYELAQARVAHSNNIQPKGFKLDDYIKQEQERSKQTGDARTKAEREKSAAMDARNRWLTYQKESDKLLGKTSQFPDPMNPNAVKGTDPELGAGGYTVGGGDELDDKNRKPIQDPTMRGNQDRDARDDDNLDE